MLFWTAVINGVVAVPIMLAMMFIVTSRKAISLPPWIKALGWLATALMALAVGLLFWPSLF
jgi:Mn2+/Fe2+ NRAMP family transporter